jgi:ABC-type nitrate/sulfonate/bicarbonate transport system substrate-binding protein
MLLPALCNKTGTDYNAIQYIYLEGAAKPAALISGQVDAVACDIALIPSLQKAANEIDGEIGYIMYADYGIDTYSGTWWTSDKLIRTNPDLVGRIVEALQRGYAYSFENLDAALDIYIKYNPEITKEVAREEFINYYQGIVDKKFYEENGMGYINPDLIRSSVLTTYELLNIEEGDYINPEDIYTNEFIKTDIFPKSWPF